MVLPKSGAVRVRVLSGRVSPEVKRSVDQHASGRLLHGHQHVFVGTTLGNEE